MVRVSIPDMTPAIVLKNSPSWLLKRTALLEFSYSAWMAWPRPLCTLKILRTCHRPTCRLCLTPSWSLWSCGTDRAGVVSASLWWLNYWRSVLVCLVFCRQLFSLCLESAEDNSEHDLDGMADGTIVFTLLSWPVYGKGMTSDFVHSFSHSFVSGIFWHITVRTVVVSPPFLSRSEGTLSTPGDSRHRQAFSFLCGGTACSGVG